MKTSKKAADKKAATKKPTVKKTAEKKNSSKNEVSKKTLLKKEDVKKPKDKKQANEPKLKKVKEPKVKKVKEPKPKKIKVPKPEKIKKVKVVALPKPPKKTLTKKREYKTSSGPTVPLATKISSSGKKLYTMEFVIKSSPVILYDFVTATSNMAQWFADEVDRSRDDIYTFTWDGNSQVARVIDEFEHELVRYQWVDGPADEYFEFKVTHTEITGDTVLIITDFCDPKDMKDAQFLWDSQVKNMIQQLGA